MAMKHLDLFSGIGGFALACEWAGIETIGFAEIDKFCQKVLRKHWPEVPIVEDIRDVKAIKEIVANATGTGLQGGEAKQRFGGSTEWDAVGQGLIPGTSIPTGGDNGRNVPAILITAGFPCQPFSVAGKRGGETDDRYLWPETIAVIKAIKPSWVLLENVAGIIPMALDTVLSDLEGAGYAWETLVVPAVSVGAPHRRDRIWVLAYTNTRGHASELREKVSRGAGKTITHSEPSGRSQRGDAVHSEGEDATDTQREGLEGADTEGDSRRAGQPCEYGQGRWQADWWAVEPDVGRVAHGIPSRVDRLKSLGNAIVPQVAYEIIRVIKGAES